MLGEAVVRRRGPLTLGGDAVTVVLLTLALVVWIPVTDYRRRKKRRARALANSNVRVLSELKRISVQEPHRIIETSHQ